MFLSALVRHGRKANSRLAAAMQQQSQRGIAQAMRAVRVPTSLACTHPTHPHIQNPSDSSNLFCCAHPTQDDAQADLQPAYSYDPPGRNHLFVPGELCCPSLRRVSVCSSSSIADTRPGTHPASCLLDNITQDSCNPKQLPSKRMATGTTLPGADVSSWPAFSLQTQAPSTSTSACCVP
jgi:hypothetical protein